jgi:rsbT co-antagonist protein RsbR
MWRRFGSWLTQIPYHDGLERRQAALVQLIEAGIMLATIALAALPFFSSTALSGKILLVSLLGSVSIVSAISLALLRAGRIQGSVLLLSVTLALLCSVILYGTTLAQGAVTMFAFGLPITLSGLIAGRRGLVLVFLVSVVSVSVSLLLERAGAPGAGFAYSTSMNMIAAIIGFAVVAALIGVFTDRIGTMMRDSLVAQRARERELEALSRRLETTVRERTADLEMALRSLESRAAEQERLLAENNRQQAAIREISVPVLPVSATTLVMPLVGSLDGERLLILQDRALAAIMQSSARRLLLDITGVPLVDSYVAQGLIRTLQAARLLGAEVALVGVRPEVAQSIVGLGIDLSGMRTYADLQSALH